MAPERRVPHLAALDGLRCCAALFVLWTHGIAILFKSDPPIPSLGVVTEVAGLGMTLFFVLSGFVIHYGYHQLGIHEHRGGVRRFLRARVARLYPLYLVVLILDVWACRRYPSIFAQAPRALAYHFVMLQAWWYKVLGHNSVIYQFRGYSGVTWSLSVEMFFYATYLVIVRWIRRLERLRTHILVGLVVCAASAAGLAAVEWNFTAINHWAAGEFGPVADVSSGVQDSFIRWLVYFCPLSHLGEFVVGVLAANWYLRRPEPPPFLRAHAAGLTAVLIAAIVSLTFYIYAQPVHVLGLNGSSLYAPLVAVLILWCARGGHAIAGWLGSDLMRKGGDASYAIYLLHVPSLLSWGTPTYGPGQLPWGLCRSSSR
jgi:peptidoglycan/LPS O-acetylase OafA/YrhL